MVRHVRTPSRSVLVVSAVVASLLAVPLLVGACQDGGGKPKPTGSGASAASAAPKGSATIQGTVRFTGTAPPPEPWGGSGNADCKPRHEATIQLVQVQDGKLQDAFVYIKEGLPPGSHDPPAEKVSLDQKNCEFVPRVFGVVAAQEIEAGNSDAFMHNVKSAEFNQGFPSAGVKRTVKLNDEKVMSVIMCDVHPWMRAYAGVMSHPYFAVTKADGAFTISGLVDGTYTVAAWHEKLGEVEVKAVKASAAEPGKAELTFAK
jgi:hypothetical protein